MLPIVVGHRGAAALAPENTLEGIRYTAAQGIAAVEVDIALTKDGVPVLLHDERLDRTTNGRGALASHTLSELQQLDAGAWFDHRFAGARIPTLTGLIDTCLDCRLALNAEIKPTRGTDAATAAAAAHLLADRWPADGPYLIFSSFSMESLAVAKTTAPGIPRAALFSSGRATNWLTTAADLDCVAVHVKHNRLSDTEVSSIKHAGLACGAYTVNDSKTARQLRERGVDYVFSDCPAEIAASLG